MIIFEVPEDLAAEVLEDSLSWVERASPGMTASSQVNRGQKIGLIAGGLLLVLACVLAPIGTVMVLTTLATFLYLITLAHRVCLVRIGLSSDASIQVADEDALAVADEDLPIYTLLVPAYGEPEVLPDLVRALERIDYPRDRLDVKLLLEVNDEKTIAAARSIETDLPIDVLLLPAGEPQTKPRALNYGLYFSRGSIITIYDAEDHPDPLQLRRAVVAFSRVDDDVACLQAKLSFYGGTTNLLTRWFTAEYATWFSLYLPGLASTKSPIPLGGTSNHFLREALEDVGCWDAYNVTEDCDLGIRLQRKGYRVGILDSATMEEPNVDVVMWVKQRSRWYKGYLQTWLIGMRDPRGMVRDLGWAGMGHFCLFVGSTPVLAVLNLFFWSMTLLWLVTKAAFIQALFPGVLYYLAIFAWFVGNVVIVYLSLLTLRAMNKPEFLVSALLSPLYWIVMSIAALRAAVQLVTDPSHWEKTAHGLHLQLDSENSLQPSPKVVAAPRPEPVHDLGPEGEPEIAIDLTEQSVQIEEVIDLTATAKSQAN
ncbi:MAG: glycosyltransferase family 2 protein [Microthrixaceae bacterium]